MWLMLLTPATSEVESDFRGLFLKSVPSFPVLAVAPSSLPHPSPELPQQPPNWPPRGWSLANSLTA